MRWLDHFAEKSARAMARRTSRRSFLGSLGISLVGAAALPLLPVARGSAATATDNKQDPTHCEYWRHCAIDGYLCGCCGGSEDTCPPGTTQSPITLVGTCHNPAGGVCDRPRDPTCICLPKNGANVCGKEHKNTQAREKHEAHNPLIQRNLHNHYLNFLNTLRECEQPS